MTGPYRCCPHCAEDPLHDDDLTDNHEVTCTTCERADLRRELVVDSEPTIMEVLTVHRRLTNTRGCTGCDWRSTAPGRNGDPDTMRHRHAQFNEHLTHAIVAALTSS